MSVTQLRNQAKLARNARLGTVGPSLSRLFEPSRLDLKDIYAQAAANTAALVTDDKSNGSSCVIEENYHGPSGWRGNR